MTQPATGRNAPRGAGCSTIPRRSLLRLSPLAFSSRGKSDPYFGRTGPPSKQRLIYAIASEPSSLDPASALGASDSYVLPALFDGLVSADSESLEPQAALATHYEVNAGLTEFTFLFAWARESARDAIAQGWKRRESCILERWPPGPRRGFRFRVAPHGGSKGGEHVRQLVLSRGECVRDQQRQVAPGEFGCSGGRRSPAAYQPGPASRALPEVDWYAVRPGSAACGSRNRAVVGATRPDGFERPFSTPRMETVRQDCPAPESAVLRCRPGPPRGDPVPADQRWRHQREPLQDRRGPCHAWPGCSAGVDSGVTEAQRFSDEPALRSLFHAFNRRGRRSTTGWCATPVTWPQTSARSCGRSAGARQPRAT